MDQPKEDCGLGWHGFECANAMLLSPVARTKAEITRTNAARIGDACNMTVMARVLTIGP